MSTLLASPPNTDELVRNALLRRVDWRFFLPTARQRLCVSFGADTLLSEALEMMSDRVVDSRIERDDAADLAVLVDPDNGALRAAWRALRPGGACYAEWNSPLVRGTHGASRRLTAAGFTDTTVYWAWPPPGQAQARYWVPLGVSAVRRHFLATRPRRPGVASVVRRIGRTALWRAVVAGEAIAPVCAVARKRSAAGVEEPWAGINLDIARLLYDGWAEWGFGPRPRLLSWVMLTGGEASFNKLVGLVSAGADGQPRAAVKLSRCSISDEGLLREARALEVIAATRPALHGVPRLLFCEPNIVGLAVGETIVSGRPLDEWLRRKTLRDIALAVTDWFTELAGHPLHTPRSEWWPRLVEPILDAFAGLPGPRLVPDLVARTRRLFASIEDLPLTISHGDAGPTNVFMDDQGRISVIDWEDCEPSGAPVADLAALLTFLIFHLEDPWRSGRCREVYRATLDPATEYGRLRAECLGRYARRVGLPASVVGPLSLIPWMQRSLREHQGMVDATLGPEGREAFSRQLYAALWEEDLRAAGAL